jgi:RNA polymerase sigma factor (sigma-70 family)
MTATDTAGPAARGEEAPKKTSPLAAHSAVTDRVRDLLPPMPTEDPRDDDQLLRAFAAGEAEAFETLYARHQAALYRFVARLLGREAATQADEVFQDSWLRVLQACHSWQPQGASFRTWLFTIAHHRAVDCLRKSGRELQPLQDEDSPWEPEASAWADWPSASSEDQLFWRAAGQRLLDCLDALPLAQKSAFLLQHEEGLALDEIAAALQLGFETVKTRLRYAKTKLRTCMGAYLPAPGSWA